MIDQWMATIMTMISNNGWIAFMAAFIWGIMSVVFSPCHLASVPLVMAYIGGATEDRRLRSTFLYSLLFSFGLFLMIALIGAGTSLAGRMLGDLGTSINLIVGIVLVVLGLFLAGWIPFEIPSIKKMNPGRKGVMGALLLGGTYGLISGPCTFGFIAPMLAMTAIADTFQRGVALIVLFSIGHCLPILVGGMSTSFVQKLVSSEKIGKTGAVLKKTAGVVFVLIGIYLALK